MLLLYGVTLNTSRLIREDIEKYLGAKNYKVHTVCRYRKEGVFQYANSLEEGAVIVLEEELQGASSYEVEEIQQLTDIGSQHKIIFLMDRKHYGSDFVRAVYACGILNAVFRDDISPKLLVQMITQNRTNEAARAYYGIQGLRDAEKASGIVNEVQLSTYLEYVESGETSKDINDRYRFVSSRLGGAENEALSGSLSSQIMFSLKGNEVYQFYKSKRGRGRFFLPKKKDEKLETCDDAPVDSVPGLYVEQEKDKDDHHPNSPFIEIEEEEDLLTVLERFRECRGKQEEYLTEDDSNDRQNLLLQFGCYLQEIDN